MMDNETQKTLDDIKQKANDLWYMADQIIQDSQPYSPEPRKEKGMLLMDLPLKKVVECFEDKRKIVVGYVRGNKESKFIKIANSRTWYIAEVKEFVNHTDNNSTCAVILGDVVAYTMNIKDGSWKNRW
jgi:hypothetical protein